MSVAAVCVSLSLSASDLLCGDIYRVPATPSVLVLKSEPGVLPQDSANKFKIKTLIRLLTFVVTKLSLKSC